MLKIDLDYNLIRKCIINAIQSSTGLDQNHVIVLEAEEPNSPRPSLPYIGMKITTPGARYGDDTKQNIPGSTKWSSGGPRKMTASFEAFASTHEDAYNLMTLWQTSLDEENIQSFLRASGIAVWIIGTVADLTALLNTGYEGRAQMDCQFGLAVNLTSDLGEMDSVTVTGAITTDSGIVNTVTEVTEPEN